MNIPPAYLALHPNASVKVSMSWPDTTMGNSDYDLYVFNGTVGATSGSQGAAFQSASSANPEIAVITPLAAGPRQYTIKIVPFTPAQEVVNVRIELQAGGAGGGGGGGGSFGGPDTTVPGNPRYQNFYAPTGSSAEPSSGEFNIGFDPITRRIMTMNAGPIWRLTPPEVLLQAKPECCEALWEDKSAAVTNTGLDPILWTDQKSGRTFASNSTAGANAVYAYTDAAAPFNDGDTWIEVGAAPANGGADHQTIGSGPYPNIAPYNLPGGLGDPTNPVTHGEMVFYCSQDLVGSFCQRSDDLGASYGPGVSATGNGIGAQGCGGLHGHIHVAADGTTWLPDKSCGMGKQGGARSTDGGVTWSEFLVSGNNDLNGGALFTSSSQTGGGADPSIALDSASTAYYCYVNNEAGGTQGHVHVAVGKRTGSTINWIRDTDVGLTHGIINAAHPEAVGGSTGRAACGFFGTNVAGNYQAGAFTGAWYAFIATTYDEGVTWTTVNASPNDPVQSMTGIWQQGGSGQNGDRNLLDFNEITVDNKGRVLYGYSDGCTTPACIAGTAPSNLGAAMRVARQFGGKSLFASFDTPEPAAPNNACLSGTRDPSASHLTWKAPDNGGADITGYQILRGTTAGFETVLVANTFNAKTTYNDTTADPLVAHYFYKVQAINTPGTGLPSNEVDLAVVVPPPPENVCALPGSGLTKLTDPAGDTSAILGLVPTPAPPGADLKSFQISQPYTSDGVIKLAFTINTWDNGQAVQPAGSSWYVAMKIVNGATTTFKGVHMTWNGATPTFESYTPSTNNAGGTDGRFVTAGSLKPAEANSSYAAPFNKVIIVVKASDLGLSPGNTISGFVSAVSQTEPMVAVATALYDQMPNSLAFTGSYTVNDNVACKTNYALSALGGLGIGSTTYPYYDFGAASAIDGDLTGQLWGSGGGWNDGTYFAFPDTLEVDFSPGSKVIDEINVFTLQNNWTTAGPPDLTTPATGEGILDFHVEYWNGAAFVSIPVCNGSAGGCNVTGNDKAWRRFTFPAIATSKIRVVVTDARNGFSRIVELEGVGTFGQ